MSVKERNVNDVAARIMAADWEGLTEAERHEAIAVAEEEGRRAAQRYLEEPVRRAGRGPALRRTRWYLEHGDLDRLNNDVLYLYARAQTLACEHEYVHSVIEARAPEGASWWWALAPENRAHDPRVCCFCDGYERERRRILELPEPPTSVADLQSYLWEAKEQEREQARLCLAQIEETADATPAALHSVEGWDYRRMTLGTDLAEMLLGAAACRLDRRERPVGP